MISTRALLHCLVVAIAALPLVGTLSGQFSETFVGAISNSASYAVSGENGYGIARGSLFVVFGENLGPNQLQYAQTFPLPKALAGTSVQITMGATSYDAIMIYSLAGQIAAILPSSVPAGSGSLTVTYNNQSSPPAPITVVQSAFGTYTLSSNGIGAGIVTRPNYQVASFENPVNPGDILIIWGTGLGPVAGNEAAGPLPGNQFPGTEVFAGNQSASVQYAGRSGCCAGLDQIVFQVPSTVPLGCFVPIAVRSGGVVSNFTTIPIATPSQNCSDSVGFPSNLVTKAQAGQTVTVGLAGIGAIPILQGAGFSFLQSLTDRFSQLLHAKVPEREVRRIITAHGSQRLGLVKAAVKKYSRARKARRADLRAALRIARSFDDDGAAAGFTQLGGIDGLTAQFGSILPPAGACMITQPGSFSFKEGGATSMARDAGAQLALSGPVGTQILTEGSTGEYQVGLGSGYASGQLPVGTYTLSGTGGANVGRFSASLASGGLQWTNKDSVNVVDRSQPLTVTWAGSNLSGYVLFGGSSSNGGFATAFACAAEAQNQTLTVPQFILNAMPASAPDRGYLFLAMYPFQNSFAAVGLDAGYFIDFSNDSKQLAYQ